jgi:hypothetical protein
MRAIILFVLSCVSIFAAGTNDVQVFTRSYKVMPEDSLATIEVFTRGGQTNLIRKTHTKDGVVSLRSQSFYHNGIEVGSYMYQIANGTNTGVNSSVGAPYSFYVGFDAYNRPRSVQIRATNLVMLDWFGCTNGVFYPLEAPVIQEANTRLPKLPPK